MNDEMEMILAAHRRDETRDALAAFVVLCAAALILTGIIVMVVWLASELWS